MHLMICSYYKLQFVKRLCSLTAGSKDLLNEIHLTNCTACYLKKDILCIWHISFFQFVFKLLLFDHFTVKKSLPLTGISSWTVLWEKDFTPAVTLAV